MSITAGLKHLKSKKNFMQDMVKLTCDYLVIGAGAASLAFVDTLLTEIPTAKIILVDKNPCPGGHWVHSYGFVHLHQPSLLYGIASRQLEGNWLRLLLTKFTLPWNHYASKKEILSHYQEFINDKVSSGQVEYYPNCEYDFGHGYKFSSLDGSETYDVEVKEKLINGILGQCVVPSQNPVKFPVDKGIQLMTPNEIFSSFHDKSRQSDLQTKKYVVLGGGKTAMDTVIYLQNVMKIIPDNISWIIPNDTWMIWKGTPWSKATAMLKFDNDQDKALEYLEEKGEFVRLDKNVKPTKFKAAVIRPSQLSSIQNIKNVIRKGRVSSIKISDHQAEGKKVIVTFDKSFKEPTETFSSVDDHIFVHCTSPGPFNDADVKEIFVSDQQMDLYFIFLPPVPTSYSTLAFLEAARKRGSLDMELGNKLSNALNEKKLNTIEENVSENDVLKAIFLPLSIRTEIEGLRAFINMAVFLAIGDCDPMITYKWMKGNRLSFLSIPGAKCRIFETLEKMIVKGKIFGFNKEEIEMFRLLRDKLEPLKGY